MSILAGKRLVTGWLWTAVAAIAIVSSVMLLAPRTALSSGGSSADLIFLATGVGDKTFLTAATTNAKTGTKACTPGKLVEVLATIAGGRAGNSVRVEATCGGIVVASTTAYDPGFGYATGTQIPGDGECHIFTSGGSQPASEWITKCHFYN